jgi:hypothetical protein
MMEVVVVLAVFVALGGLSLSVVDYVMPSNGPIFGSRKYFSDMFPDESLPTLTLVEAPWLVLQDRIQTRNLPASIS